jgi:hypothetical protein
MVGTSVPASETPLELAELTWRDLCEAEGVLTEAFVNECLNVAACPDEGQRWIAVGAMTRVMVRVAKLSGALIDVARNQGTLDGAVMPLPRE